MTCQNETPQTNDMSAFEAAVAARLDRRRARIVGRGTTALFVALRAIATRDGTGDAILPDIICSTVLDGVLLAGFTPVFAEILPRRFTLDYGDVRRKITPRTRAVIAAHLFGHVEAIPPLGVPVIEDAVQGLGSDVVGRQGTLAFISFDRTKMIGGRGGVVLTDDETLPLHQIPLAVPTTSGEGRFADYRHHLDVRRLLRPFDASPANLERIGQGWSDLDQDVTQRNAKARYLYDRLADRPLQLPELRAGDVIWRFSFAAPNRAIASWILRRLQMAGLPGSSLYPPLSDLFAPDPGLTSGSLAHRMVNLWVDSSVDTCMLDRMITIVRSAPYSLSTPR